jgi:DNA polymerase III subunit delta
MPLPSIEILAGPETGRRNERIAQIREECTKEWGSAPEEHKLYAFETDVQALLGILRNGSLFSAGKLVILFSAELVKGKADTSALAAYIRKPADTTTLLLVTEGYGLEKPLEDAAGKEHKKTFWELSEGEKTQWVRDFFRREGLEAEGDAVDAILELVENNTEALKAECARLALFSPRGTKITSESVESYIAHNREEDAFSLFDRMASGSLEKAYETLDAILVSREGSGIGLMAGLLWSFRRLRSLHEALASGVPYDQAARSLRITSRKLQAVYDAARRRWPPAACSALIAFGVETDAQLRAMGTIYERLLLELFVYACVAKKGPVPLTAPADAW